MARSGKVVPLKDADCDGFLDSHSNFKFGRRHKAAFETLAELIVSHLAYLFERSALRQSMPCSGEQKGGRRKSSAEEEKEGG